MKGKTEKGLISVRFIEEESILRCEVEDNGVGRSDTQEKKEHNSLATVLTNDRVSYFNESSSGGAFKLQIFDLKDANKLPTGTKAVLTIPLDA